MNKSLIVKLLSMPNGYLLEWQVLLLLVVVVLVLVLGGGKNEAIGSRHRLML